jgi:dTDP-4-amino-4,6-dideoxygalactose transaminase
MRGIGTEVYYPAGLYDNPVYKRRLSQRHRAFPVSGKACEEVLSIPVHPQVSKNNIEYIMDAIQSFFKK